MSVCRFMGVDPGVSGGLAFFDSEGVLLKACNMPVVKVESGARKTRNTYDVQEIIELLNSYQPSICFMEQVGAMPRQGVSSTFFFGYGYGLLQGLVLARNCELHLVTPTSWKGKLGLSFDKEDSLDMARRLWPEHGESFRRKKDDGPAEAALIAHSFLVDMK